MDLSLLDELQQNDRQVNAQQKSRTKRQLRNVSMLLTNQAQEKRQKRETQKKQPRYKQPDPEMHHQKLLAMFELGMHDKPLLRPDPQLHQVYLTNYENWHLAREMAMILANEKDLAHTKKNQIEREAAMLRSAKSAHAKKMYKTFCLIDAYHGQRVKASHESITHVDIKHYFLGSESNEKQKVISLYKSLYYESVVDSTMQVNISVYKDGMRDSDLIKHHGEITECPSCSGTLVADYAQGTVTCVDCAVSFDGGEGIGFKQTFSDRQQSSVRTGMPYERVSHFKEFLTRLEGTERTVIPENVITALLRECQQMRLDPLKQPQKITYRFVRLALRRTGFCNYFENITQLISRLTGRPPNIFSDEQRNTLISIFDMIQIPFEKHRGKRKNFLSYAYVLYKLCELLGLRMFLPYLPLLKAPENLLATDLIWQKICEECNFEYIPTQWIND